MTEDRDRLIRAAMLGEAIERNEREEVAKIYKVHKNTISEASVQLDAAHICVAKALELLRSVPELELSMLVIMLSMADAQIQGWRDTLNKGGN